MPLSLDQRIDTVSNELQSLGRLVAEDEDNRRKLLGISNKAVADFETPVETIWKMIMSVSWTAKDDVPDLTYYMLTQTCIASCPICVDGFDSNGCSNKAGRGRATPDCERPGDRFWWF